MELHKIIKKLKNILRPYYYKLLIVKSNFKNLNLRSFYIKNKLENINIKKTINYKFNKKFLLIIPSLSRGGAERQIVKLANLLSSKKFSVTLLVMNNDMKYNLNNSYICDLNKNININFLKKNNFKNVRSVLLNFEDDHVKKNLSFLSELDLFYTLQLIEYLKSKKDRIIISYLDDANIIAGLAGLISEIPRIILSIRSVPPYNLTFYKDYWKQCYKFFSQYKNIKIICNSKTNARKYEKWLKFKKNTIKIVYNIFDFKSGKSNSQKINKNKINFGTIGRLAPEKNYFHLIKIITKLEKNIYLKIIGKGYLKMRLINFIKKLGLSSRVKILDETPKINKFLSELDVFILASNIEGTPNVLLEAQNYCLPIFATNVGGVNETIIKNYTGFNISDHDSIDAAKQIKSKLQNKNFFKKKSIKTIKMRLRKFSSNEVYKDLRKNF